jgi:hypothetical protein
MTRPGYLVDKPAAPSAAARYFNQRVLPVAIDSLGGIEAGLEAVAQRTRRQPGTALAIACGLGFLATVLARRRSAIR